VNSILYKDWDGDGNEDILLTGNFYPFRAQEGPCDASIGSLLKGDGKGGFTVVNRNQQTALYVPGDVRDMVELKTGNSSIIVISKNNDRVQVLKQ
jgi:enediyne biosynthesis protein E4